MDENQIPDQDFYAENKESKKENFEANLYRKDPDIEFVNVIADKVSEQLDKVIIGQTEIIEQLFAGLLCNGHILIEGVPGIAKTLIVKLLAKTISTQFRRIQFTPDLMPSDVIGTSVYDMKTSGFYFRKGPVFSNVILVDEINRSPAKTQSALFEVMEERQVTADGQTYTMEYPLFIVATQNPIEQEGTYRLPEAQLDRFLFRLKMLYPSLEEEKLIMKRFRNDFTNKLNETIEPVITVDDLERCSKIIERLHISDELIGYIAEIVNTTRNHGDIYLGASPRASLSIMKASKAIAAMRGNSFVTPDDIKSVIPPVLNHRIILRPEKEIEGVETEDVIQDIISKIEVPR